MRRSVALLAFVVFSLSFAVRPADGQDYRGGNLYRSPLSSSAWGESRRLSRPIQPTPRSGWSRDWRASSSFYRPERSIVPSASERVRYNLRARTYGTPEYDLRRTRRAVEGIYTTLLSW